MTVSSDYMASMFAAKYKAERDQARQEADRMRPAYEWVQEHGGLEQARYDYLDGIGFGKLVDGIAERMCICTEGLDCQDAKQKINDELDKRLMPPGMEWLLEVWPKWSNGDYCKFGDWWKAEKYGEDEPQQFFKLSIYTPEQLKKWGQDEGDNYGYEWDFMRPSDTKYRPDKVECPEPIGADGLPIKKGDKIRILDQICTREYCTVQKFGMSGIDGSLLVFDEFGTGWKPLDLAHVEEEPPDSWEHFEEDAENLRQTIAFEFGDYEFDDSGNDSVQTRLVDLVRRAKALAEKED